MGRRHQDREIIINMVSAMLQVGSKVSKDRGGGEEIHPAWEHSKRLPREGDFCPPVEKMTKMAKILPAEAKEHKIVWMGQVCAGKGEKFGMVESEW